MHPEEIWIDVPGYEGRFLVSTLGRVKSVNIIVKTLYGIVYTKKDKILKQGYNENLYLEVTLNYRKFLVHRLVALAFIQNPHNKLTVNHINGIKTDNRLINLEWATHSENVKHSITMGLATYNHQTGSRNWKSILTDDEVLKIKELSRKGLKQKEIRVIFNHVNQSTIHRVVTNKTWSKNQYAQ